MVEVPKTVQVDGLSQGGLKTLRCLQARLDAQSTTTSTSTTSTSIAFDFFAHKGINASASTASSFPP